MEHALAVLVERGATSDATILQNNLAIARYPVEGPARSLSAVEEAVAFCRKRGLTESATLLETNSTGLLVELGRPGDALILCERLASELEGTGDLFTLVEVRAVQYWVRSERGEPTAAADVDWLVRTARAIATVDIMVAVLAPVAARSAASDSAQTRGLLAELAEKPGSRGATYYLRAVPSMVRAALRAKDHDLAARLLDGLETPHPLGEHVLHAARAQLTDDDGDHARAAAMYAEAVDRWSSFGNELEVAYAILGRGRALLLGAREEAADPLREAERRFADLGFVDARSEARTLLVGLRQQR
jgi:hypothetical protein